ncbi:MAG: LysR family transcriptional regulator [Marinicella sp.]|nr:LysR family transcriptional regulator [Xanthomonadales bacterium]
MNKLKDMQVFIRIVEAGSITKAAEQLEMVKSAVSQRLNRLENYLGTQLIQRTTRSQSLTASGQKYYQDCLRILEEIREMDAGLMQEKQALAGKIRLAAPYSFGLKHLGPAIRKFNDLHPEVIFDIDFNDRFVDLVNEGFDLGIRITQLSDSSLMARKICQSQMVLCASPTYLEKYGEPQKPEDLTHNHRKIRYSTDAESWHFTNTAGQVCKVKLPTILVCNNGEFMTEAAQDGCGLVAVPDFICYQAIASGSLKPLLCNYRMNQTINIYAVYPQNRHLPLRVRKLIDFLAGYFGNKPYWQVIAN